MIEKRVACISALGSDAYLVGGSVRDWVLFAKPGHDIDIAVPGDPKVVAEEIALKFSGTVVPLSHIHGVIRVAGPRDFKSKQPAWNVDVNGFTGSIENDLSRRDFSVNAMAVSIYDWPSPDAVIDPSGGKADLATKTIRVLSSDVFRDDPGRLLRAIRLAGQLKFRVDPSTSNQIKIDSSLLSDVSPERVRDEFLKILSVDGSRSQLEVLDHFGLLEQVIPELQHGKGVDQPNMHYWDVWGHTMHTVEAAELIVKGHQHSPVFSCVPWTEESEEHFNEQVTDGHTRATVLKLAALFHDIAKPQTKSQDDTGRTRFFGHSEQGAALATQRLSQLRVSSKGIDMVAKMVEHHLRPTGMKDGDDWPTDRAIYRYFRDVGDVAIDTLYLCMADYLGAKGPALVHEEWINHARMVGHILHVGTSEPVSSKTTRLITGHDLMTHYNLQPGPEIGAVLQRVEEARAAGEINTKEQALQMAGSALIYLAEQLSSESYNNGTK